MINKRSHSVRVIKNTFEINILYYAAKIIFQYYIRGIIRKFLKNKWKDFYSSSTSI